MEIIKKVSTHNTSAKPQRSIDYIVIHYTAGTTSKKGTALNTANYFSKSKVSASADFIVDDAQIVQYNPDLRNRYCWAVGSAKGKLKSKAGGSLYGKATNSNCVSIEICSNLKKLGYKYNINDILVLKYLLNWKQKIIVYLDFFKTPEEVLLDVKKNSIIYWILKKEVDVFIDDV